MGNGDCIYITALFRKPPPDPVAVTGQECGFEMPVFWSDDSNKYHHDKSSWVVFCEEGITSVAISLEKKTGSWAKVADLNNNTLGTFFALGFINNRYKQKACGFLLDWNLVYNAYGNGQYRMKFDMNYGGSAISEYSFHGALNYTLKKWHPVLADHTCRIEWNGNAEQGWFSENRVDFYGSDFYGQIRVPKAFFGAIKDSIEQDFSRTIRQGKGESSDHRRREIIDKYSLEIVNAPAYLHTYIKVAIRQAYYCIITDYNRSNADNYTDVKVLFTNGSEPVWTSWTNKASVTYELEEYLKTKQTYS